MAAMSEITHDDHPTTGEPDDAGHGPGGHDEHGDHAEKLGPIDWFAWGAGLLGVGAGLVVAACLYFSTSL
jgi:hypothetical protein